ncbi:MAG: hypothetical protein K9J16_06525 [Melioribacteraceae bacterium]|nr:hypothetical protein [Melioribacteraceae bacterium]MCF8353113.1 hypothetical protein [Melioribacteraceae bacterium]MCF8392741.1 hypothetical protein [Melioribacteraceae bacterium]MCF8418272.1 hypothetical protein [Melioribacteraceae bacterium]
MRLGKKFFYIVIIVLLSYLSVNAQSTRDSLSFMLNKYSHNNLFTYFNKELNTYSLNSGIRYSTSFNKLFVGVDENYKSTFIRSGINNKKDEQYLSFISEYEILPVLKFGLLLNNSIYSDDRKIAINQASNFNSSIFTKFSPVDKIKIVPFGGISKDIQIGEDDQGYIYGSEASVDKFKTSDLMISSSMRFQNEDISPRKNSLRLVKLNVDSEIDESIINRVSGHYSEQRKDFYFEADTLTATNFGVTNNIQSRTESNYTLQNQFLVGVPNSNFRFDVNGRIGWRDIERDTRYILLDNISSSTFDTKIEEFKLDFSALTLYNFRDFSGNIRISFSEREEKHLAKRIEGVNEIFFNEREKIESQKNNKSQQTAISASSIIDITNKDKINLSLLHRKLRYDTQSDENYDDRDELLTMFRAAYLRSINPFFDFFVNLEGSFHHIVYIFAERSSNNNIKRVLKLSSGGTYRGKNISSSNSVEVSANYTVYDFEEFNASFKSFAFRQFQFKDSTKINLTRSMFFAVTAHLKLSEQGDFKWSQFSSKPVRFLAEGYGEPKLFYTYRNLKMGVGIRYFRLTTYGYSDKNVKRLETDYSSIGPVSEISFNIINRLRLRIYGYYEFINNEENVSKELANMNLRLDWQF